MEDVAITAFRDSTLGGGDPGAPMDSPVSWVVLATALGQVGQSRSSRGSAPRAVYPAAAAVAALAAGTPTVRTPNVNTGVVTGRAVFVNTAGGTLTYTAPDTTTGGGAVTIDRATGAFSYTPTPSQRQRADLSTNDTFTVTASNGTSTAFQTISVPVDPGTPVAGTASVGSPASWTGLVSGFAKFSDGSGRVLAYSTPATTAGGGAVSINSATGAFTYTPTQVQRQNAGLNTTDSFTVTSSNGIRTATQTITVAVDPGTPVSGAPWLRSPNADTGAVTGIAKFTDGSGRTLTYSAPSTTAGGATVTINAATGDFTYTPTLAQRRDAGANTTETVTVTASNGVRSVTATIVVPVDPGRPLAGTPRVGTPNLSTGVVTGTATGTDSIGRTISYSAPTTSAGGGAVAINSGTGAFTYAPSQSQRQNAVPNTTDTFTVTISNGARTTTQVITVGVDPGNPVNGSPTVGTPNAVTGVVNGSARATDSVGGPLTFSAPTTSAGGGAVNIDRNTGAFTYTPSQTQRRGAGLSTTDTLTVTISNGARTATQAVTVNVDPGTPIAGSPTVGVPSNWTGVVGGTARFGDGSGRTLSYSAPTTTTGGGALTINSGTGAFTYTPTIEQRRAAGISTTDSFTVTVTNGLRTTTQVVTVPVEPGAPVSNVPWVRTPSRVTGVVTGIVKFSDPLGRTLTYSASQTSAGGGAVTINAATGDFTYTPTQTQRQAAGPTTTDVVIVTASNGVRSATQTITVPVDPNSPPVIGNLTPAYRAGGVVDGTLSVSDFDVDRVTLTADTPTNGALNSFNSTTGAFRYTPTTQARHGAAADNATSSQRNATFTVTANDGRGGITTYAVTFAITPLNAAPTGTGSLGAPDPTTGQALGQLRFTDADNDSLSYSIALQPGRGSIAFDPSVNGAFTYTPTWQARHYAARDGAGPQSDTFTLAVNDGHGATVTVPFSVGIVPFNSALAQTATIGGPDPYEAAMVVNVADADGDVPTYTVVSGPSKGTLNVVGGYVVYKPDRAISHPIAAGAPPEDDSFTLQVNDGYGSTVTVPVTLTIGPANYIPAFSTLTIGTPDAQTGQVSGSLTATDAVDDDVRTYSISRGPVNGGAVTIDSATGAFTYTPSGTGRQNAATAATAVGLSEGRWGQHQLMSVQRGYQGCTQAGGLCQVSGLGEARVDTYWWNWSNRPTWNTGDYVRLVDTGRTLWGGQPDLALIQYTGSGAQKQVIAASGYVESVGTGILYTGAAGNSGYYIANTVGVGRNYGGSFSYLVDFAYPNRAQLANYIVSTTPLGEGQVLASTDTFTISVSDAHGGSATTTISVPIPLVRNI